MRHPFTLLVLFLSPLFVDAQNTYPYPSSGNIGIGTASPVVKLSIYGSANEEGAISLQSAANSRFYIQQGGSLLKLGGITPGGAGAINISNSANVGIGTTAPRFPLHVISNSTSGFVLQNSMLPGSYSGAFIRCYNSGTPNGIGNRLGGILFGTNPNGTVIITGSQMEALSESAWTNGSSHPTYLRFLTVGNNSTVVAERMRITADGNIGIGTTSPQAKLAVNGDIFAKKIKVVQNGWPDYVFAEDYQLPTLNELENYIQTNKRLPDMPSAEEIEKDGLNVGEMNKKLLQKVEELTLYLLQISKQNQELKSEIELLKQKIGIKEKHQ